MEIITHGDGHQMARHYGDDTLSIELETSSQRILDGIQTHLFNGTDHWYRVIDKDDNIITINDREGNRENRADWIGYAPLMLDLPVTQYGVNSSLISDWIKNTLKQSDNSLVWDDSLYSSRKSPGYSFQAMLVWLDIDQLTDADRALFWAEHSGLWQKTPDDDNEITGGWIDWIENGTTPDQWKRFIDTSAYYIMTHGTDSIKRGYNFNHTVPEPSTLIFFFISILGLRKFKRKNS